MFENGFPREWSTIRKLAMLFRSVVNAVVAVLKTIIGNPIHITDALAKPAQALSIALEPIQDLNGYDNPWPAGGGVNKLPPCEPGTYTSSSGNSIAVVSADGTITLSGTSGGSSEEIIIPLSEECTSPSSDYYLHIGNSVALSSVAINIEKTGGGNNINLTLSSVNRISSQLTSPLNASWGRVRFRIAANQSLSGTVRPMICLDNTARSYSPYSNICPISGHTDADVIVSPTLNPLDGTTYPIPLGQTVYGGTLDVVTGLLTVKHAFGTYNGSENWGTGTNYFVLWNQPPSKSNTDTTQIANWLVGGGDSYADQGKFRVQTNGALCVGNRGGVYADVTAFKAALAETPLQVCYELATPITIQLTSQQVELLFGENNIWSDGEMTLTYLADGNASDVEALNILLGGRYVNNHEADEPSDREALDILLGRGK